MMLVDVLGREESRSLRRQVGGLAPAEMRRTDGAAALDGAGQVAKPALDIALSPADVDDRHPAGFVVFDRGPIGRALAEVTAHGGRHEVGENVDRHDISIRGGLETERQQKIDRVGVAHLDFELFLIGPSDVRQLPGLTFLLRTYGVKQTVIRTFLRW